MTTRADAVRGLADQVMTLEGHAKLLREKILALKNDRLTIVQRLDEKRTELGLARRALLAEVEGVDVPDGSETEVDRKAP